jgi:hypothetical protein
MAWDPALPGVVTFPDGVMVRGRGRRKGLPDGPVPEASLFLGKERDEAHPPWAVEWIDWPDFRVPTDPPAAVASILRLHAAAAAGVRAEVACTGGNGRTGTVISCLAVLSGVPAGEAVAWTRLHYRPRAVETRGQKRWVDWFADHLAARPPDG